ncbi:MAG TPA: KTSC domain-containing protein [Cytophagales bacterium]|nr:KTSC domain-containing protein [Cytophagales bacterium]
MEFSKTYVESSAIEALGYNDIHRILRVWLISGRVYDYYNVPELQYKAFLDAESKGKFYNLVIKKLFENCEEVHEPI